MDGTNCDICFHHYDDQTRLPRTLTCGHTLCSLCITEAIQNGQMTCPYCRQVQNISNAKDISITFALLSLSLTRSSSRSDEEASTPPPAAAPPRLLLSTAAVPTRAASLASMASVTEPDVHAGVCLSHRSFRLFWCSNCLVWVCRDCCVVDHPSKTCSIISIDHALKNLKKEEDVLFTANREAYEKHLEFLRVYQNKLKDRAEKHEEQVELFKALNESQTGTISFLEKEKERIEGTLNEAEVALKRMDAAKDHLAKVNTVESVENAKRELHIRTKILSEWISASKDDILKLGALQLSDELGQEIKMMLIAGGYSIGNPLEDAGFLVTQAKQMFKRRMTSENIRSLATMHELWAVISDNTQSAPVTLKDGRLHLHVLRKGTAPPGAFILPYANVRSLVQHPTNVFLEFSPSTIKEDKYLYITFGDNEHLHTSLIRRCSGELPPCFRDTCVYLNPGKGIPHLLTGIHPNLKFFKKVHGEQSVCNPGNGLVTLAISNGLPCFVIWSQEAHAKALTWHELPIGKVSGGIEVLEAVVAALKVAEVRIVDSGLVIN